MVKANFQKVSQFIEKMVSAEHVPGVVIGVTTAEETIYKQAFGYAHFEQKIKMTEETMFDLASLTKVTATLPSILQLLEEGELELDDPISHYLPPFKMNHQDITVKHLLTHSSGFQPEIKFFLQNISDNETIDTIAQIQEKKRPGEEVIYSDLNYILLGKIIEKIAGVSLVTYTINSLFGPIEMKDTYFNPPPFEKKRIAATEFLESLHDYRWGEVHDENTLHFGGVSGHAGLFSTLGDLSLYARMILNDGVMHKKRIISPQSIALSTDNYTNKLNLNRGLGWELYDTPSFSGQFLQDGFGHTGFTGTSIWFSKKNNYSIILLTNRVHFGRDTNISRMRRIIHNLIALEMAEAY
ncbi:serine hydrolase domain-containing protein [Robertmurraya massiliosenegalensis]|uniref:serine hydrolase domain-containing protein n=1 Tax=Robertmurraya TaxID=2837507 RepID=UPI0039A421D7